MPGPVVSKEVLSDIVLAIDTSGSISETVLENFMFQLKSLMNDFELTGKVIFWDDGVESIGSVEDVLYGKIKPKGYGGTNISPVIEYVNKHLRNSKLLIVLTDGWFSEPTLRSKVPLIWAISSSKGSIDESHLKQYGKVIYLY